MIGKTISHYKILEKLGEGGMGVVYKAQDTKLDRIVALKFLPKHLLCNNEAKTRFEHEAKAASALDHPNIATIYEIAEIEGECFISMAYIEGKSIKELLKVKVFSLNEVLDIGIQICEGLATAHEKGIVHRDIKSDNIMLTPRGQVKIMDFGLAKLRGVSKVTKEGTTLGTMPYMSPEQVQGMEVDRRSDIFSFGVVLYEMITGQLPFKGEHEAAIFYSIINETPEPLARYKANVPERLQRIIDKAIEKNRDERYQHVDEMIADLKSIRRKLETIPTVREPSKPKRLKKRSAYVYVSFAFLIITLILIKIFFTPSRAPIDSLAVLPLQNLSGDVNQEYFSDGMTEALITELQKIKSLRIISRTSVMQYKKVEKHLPEIAKDLGVKAVVEGSVLREGDIVRISVQLIQASPERHLWASSFDKPMKNILALQSDVAQAIAREVKAVITPEEQKRMENSRTVNPEAHEAYLKGRFYWNKRTAQDLETAIKYFNQAIEKDPSYALAYAGLASTYVVLPEYSGLPPKEIMPKAEASARKALELDATLAEAHAVLGFIKSDYDWDWAGAESEFKRAIELDPSYPTAHHWYSLMLSYLGRLDEALAEIKRAQELDPLSLIINDVVGFVLYYMRQYDKAIDQCKKTLELDPNFSDAHSLLGCAYDAQGRFNEAIAEFQRVRTLVISGPYGLSDLGYCYARAGKKSEALKILNELFEFSKQGYSVSFDIGYVYYGLGDKEKTFEWLEKAYQERSYWLGYLKVDPNWDGLRSDPRFVALLKKMGLEK